MNALISKMKGLGTKSRNSINYLLNKLPKRKAADNTVYFQQLRDKELICCYDYKNKRVLRSNSEFENTVKILKDISQQIIDKISNVFNSSKYLESEIVEWKKSFENAKLLLVKFEEIEKFSFTWN